MSSSRALCCPAGRQSVKTQKHRLNMTSRFASLTEEDIEKNG